MDWPFLTIVENLPGIFLVLLAGFLGGRWNARTLGRSDALASFQAPDAQSKPTWDDVVGAEGLKASLRMLSEFFRDPGKFQRLGAEMLQGVIIVGPAEAGKSIAIRAFVNSCDVPYFWVSPADLTRSDGRIDSKKIRDLYIEARRAAPCLVVIEGLDRVVDAADVTAASMQIAAEYQRPDSMLVVSIFEFRTLKGVATQLRNECISVGPIFLGLPDESEREQLLAMYLRRVPIARDVNPARLARLATGLSAVQIRGWVNQSRLLAAADGRRTVDHKLLVAVLADLLYRCNLSAEQADHEMEASLPVRGRRARYQAAQILVMRRMALLGDSTFIALGYPVLKQAVPPAACKQEIEGLIVTALAGRAAESLSIDVDQTVLAQNDLAFATRLAHKYVEELGFSRSLPQRSYDLAGATGVSLRKIERAISDVIASKLDVAREILQADTKGLEALSAAIERGDRFFGFMVPQILIEPRDAPHKDSLALASSTVTATV